MTTTLVREPRGARQRPSNGGTAARRAVFRWAWRMFRREWRQQIMVLLLLTLAVAATTASVSIVANAPPSPDATFGTANYILTLPGSDHNLSADIARARTWFGAADVIAHQQIAIPGSVDTIDLRAQSPSGPYGAAMLRLDSGHYPVGPDQVAVTATVAATYRIHVGGIWRAGGHARLVVGIVENPQNLQDNFALVAPGQVTAPNYVDILVHSVRRTIQGFHLSAGGRPPVDLRPPMQVGFPAVAVLLFAAIGLLFVGLVAVAGFAVLAGRRLRAVGMLGAVGATDRHVRLSVIVNGALVGLVAALVGGILGFGGWLLAAPAIETTVGHRIDAFSVPWLDICAGLLLAVSTAVAAAWWPARTAARVPVVAALSGRVPRPRPGRTSAALAGMLLAVGLTCLALCHQGRVPWLTIVGLLCTAIGVLLTGPLAIRGLAAMGRRAPVATRMALRDLGRYQARSSAALAAIGLALGIASAITIAATAASATDAIPPSGGNLPPDEIMIYLAPNESPANFGGGVPSVSPAQLALIQARIAVLVGRLHAGTTLPLYAATAPSAPYLSPGQGGPGQLSLGLIRPSIMANGKHGFISNNPSILYVATPALLRYFGIPARTVHPNADILTSGTGLAGELLADFAGQANCGKRAGCQVHSGHPHGPLRIPPGITHPVIQRIVLPTYTSDPNILITMHVVRTLGLRMRPAAWLLRTPRPLTAAQVVAAEHWAAAAGLTIETRTKPQQANLSLLAIEASVIGSLLALGVLAMTVGLIRAEAAADLRTLTAAGASPRTRRTLTGITAGALALLGAVTGVSGAYLALIAWHSGGLSHVPVANLAGLVIGVPLLATAAGWLLAGREPAGIARQPLV